jgi:hypothetical protein
MAFKIVIEGVVEFILERVDLIESEMEGGGIIDEGEVITGSLIASPSPLGILLVLFCSMTFMDCLC